jgi:hypothetical protein
VDLFEDKPTPKHLGYSMGLNFPNEDDNITLMIVNLWDKEACTYKGLTYILHLVKFSNEDAYTYLHRKYKILSDDEYIKLNHKIKEERFNLITKDIVSQRYILSEPKYGGFYISKLEEKEFLKWEKDNK